VALPAGIWILMIAATFFFAIAVLLSGLRLRRLDASRSER
jgi:hypothetical protein